MVYHTNWRLCRYHNLHLQAGVIASLAFVRRGNLAFEIATVAKRLSRDDNQGAFFHIKNESMLTRY